MLSIFNDNTGRTHGIKFKINPPIIEMSNMYIKDTSSVSGSLWGFSLSFGNWIANARSSLLTPSRIVIVKGAFFLFKFWFKLSSPFP